MAESKVLSKDELSQLVQFQEKERQLIFDFGRVEIQIQNLEIQKDDLIEAKKQLETESGNFSKELTKKYGEGTINLETGEISPTK